MEVGGELRLGGSACWEEVGFKLTAVREGLGIVEGLGE